MSNSILLSKLKSKQQSLLKKNKNLKNADLLKQIQPDAAGIDIGSKSHFVCVPSDRAKEPVREFTSFTEDLQAMADWLEECGVSTIAMESTGVYWIPAYKVLEARGFNVNLVDARHVKNVSGRKTDVLDCQWIQQLHTYGLLKSAFIPDQKISALGTYVKQRSILIRESGKYIQRMQKALTQMNIQLNNVIRDITGMTGLQIIRAIVAGERDPAVLAKFRNYRCKADEAQIMKSLLGDYREEHIFSLKLALELYDIFAEKLNAVDKEISVLMASFDTQYEGDISTVKLPRGNTCKHSPNFDARRALIKVTGVDLVAIPGIEASTALQIISATGIDMSKWRNEKQFTSWLGLAPGNKISGGKVLSGKTKKTTNRASQALRMAASTLIHSKTALGAFYRRIRARLGAPKAITAAARKLAAIIYQMLKHRTPFSESGQDYYEQKHRERVIKNLKRKAAELGLILVNTEAGTAT